jgi:sulfate permease, SulP family
VSPAWSGHLPIVGWVRGYDRAWTGRDIVAGLTLWGLIVPEGMAYASLAGLPAQAGLYTILASLVVYAVLGSSRHLVVSATSATSVLLGSTILALNPEDAAAYAAYAGALVLLVGALYLLAGAAKLGFVAQFLSRPVMDGFILGLAIFVVIGQLNKLFGVSKGTGNSFAKLWHVVTQLGSANWWAFGIGALAMIALFALPRLSRRLPSGLMVLAAAILLSGVLDLAGRHDVEVVGTLPQGLPHVALPQVGLSSFWILVPAAAGILLVAYSEALGVATTFANKHGYEIDPDQELYAFGTANVASGLLGGMVAAGGMSASAVNDGAGARSQLSGLTAAAMAVVTVLFLTPLFKSLPEAVLGALIIHAVSHLINVVRLRAVLRLSSTEFWLGVTALMGVLLIDVLQGIVIAMVASLLLVVYRSTRSSVTVLGELAERPGHFGSVALNPGARELPDVLVLRFDASVYYANASTNVREIKSLVSERSSPLHTVVINLAEQHDLDVTSIELLTQLVEWLHARSIEVSVVHLHQDLRAEVVRAGLLDLVGESHVFTSVSDALAAQGN